MLCKGGGLNEKKNLVCIHSGMETIQFRLRHSTGTVFRVIGMFCRYVRSPFYWTCHSELLWKSVFLFANGISFSY